MGSQLSCLPGPARLLLRIILPLYDYDNLIGCYERDYLQIKTREGKCAATRWLFWQIRRAFPIFLRQKLFGETTMIINYLKTALRSLLRNKGFSFINISGLAVGMACCLLIFLWVRHEWSYDRFHENADAINRVVISWPRGTETGWHWRTPPPLAAALKADLPEIKESTTFYVTQSVLLEHKEKRFKETIGYADSNLFSIFSIPLRNGSDQAVLSDPQAMVISVSTGKKYFGEEDPLGKTMVLNDSLTFRVAAVMEDIPSNSILDCPVILPFINLEKVAGYGNIEDWGDFGFNTFVQLQGSADPAVVNDKLREYLDVIWENPDNDTDLSLQPLARIHLYGLGGGGPIVFIWIFSAIALFILLIACINFMNLSTARSASRAREIGVRKVVGANRRRLIQQFLSESLFISLISLVFAFVIVSLLEKPMANLAEIPAGSRLLDPGIIPFFVIIAVVTGLLAGSYPAFFLSSFQSVDVLKGRRKSGSSFFRTVLVVFQFSVSVFLLIGMLIVSRQIDYMTGTPLGFNNEQIVYVPVNENLLERFEPFRLELLQNRLISHVCLSSNYLGRSQMWSTSSVTWEGKEPEDSFSLGIIYADYDFAATHQLEMAAGRFFSREHATDKTGFILNETAANAMGVENLVGMELTVAENSGPILGVLKDIHFQPLHNQVKPLVVIMAPQYFRYTAVRINGAQIPAALSHLEAVFQQFSPKYPFEFQFLDEVVDGEYRAERRSRSLLRYFVLLAGVISCLGLFGLASFMAQKRTKEIGIRKVLGASEAGIFLLLSRNFIRWVLIANLIAWPVAFLAMNRWLQSFAYRASIGWFSFAAAGFMSLGIALLTVSWQALKVARADPVQSLRYE